MDLGKNACRSGLVLTNRLSRNRQKPIGYKLSLVTFDGNGSPIASANSTNAAIDMVWNANLSACPQNCFRPVGLAWDARGRLFMSSDASSGEIYMITKANGEGVQDVRQAVGSGSSGGSPSGSAPMPSSSNSKGVKRWRVSQGSYWIAGAAIVRGALALKDDGNERGLADVVPDT
jgi:hypothetical protein